MKVNQIVSIGFLCEKTRNDKAVILSAGRVYPRMTHTTALRYETPPLLNVTKAGEIAFIRQAHAKLMNSSVRVVAKTE